MGMLNIIYMKGARKYAPVAALICWSAIVIFFMILNGNLNLEIFFVISLIGILILAVLSDAQFSEPRHMRRLKYIIAAGVAVFGWIVINKILEIIA